MATVGFGENAAETGRAFPEQGRQKHRKAELVRDESVVQVMETTRVPEPVAGTIRGKRQRPLRTLTKVGSIFRPGVGGAE